MVEKLHAPIRAVAYDVKFQVERVAPTNYSSFKKTRLNYFSHDIKIWTCMLSISTQSRRLTDREAVSIIIARPHIH